MQLLTIFAMLTAAGGVVFALQNQETVAVSLLIWNFEASLAVVLLLALALGGLVVALVSTPATLRHQWTISRQQKQLGELTLRLKTLESEADELRRHISTTDAGQGVESPYKEMPTLIATTAAPGAAGKR
jgi:putative membrane protein